MTANQMLVSHCARGSSLVFTSTWSGLARMKIRKGNLPECMNTSFVLVLSQVVGARLSVFLIFPVTGALPGLCVQM